MLQFCVEMLSKCTFKTHPQPMGSSQKVSESNHVAYQVKRNGALSTTQAHILSLHTPSTPGVGLRSKHFFPESNHVAYQIKGNRM